MDTSFVERAQCRLPPDTVMLIECAADESGSAELASCLEKALNCGLNDRPLCEEPFRTLRRDGGVLLRCERCAALDCAAEVSDWEDYAVGRIAARRGDICAPVIAGLGRGESREQAEEAALAALFRPLERRNGPLAPAERRIQARARALAVSAEGRGPWCAVKLSCCYLRRA